MAKRHSPGNFKRFKRMNNTKIKKTLLLAIGGVFVWWAWKSPAQDASGAMASLQMPYAVTQVLELEQAKIGDSTVIAYIKSSGTSYNLTASQIVFLRQQGASDAVITAMLSQPRASDSAVTIQAPEATPQFAPVTTSATTTAPAFVSQSPVTYVQTAPAADDYSYYYPSTYYAYYGWPHFWFPWSYGWGWHGGAWVGWHGGWGWGRGWHGGWGGHGGGWHR
jgi:hypothetical protein